MIINLYNKTPTQFKILTKQYMFQIDKCIHTVNGLEIKMRHPDEHNFVTVSHCGTVVRASHF